MDRTDTRGEQAGRCRRLVSATGDRSPRAQSEVVGLTLLTGVVVIVALIVGGVVIAQSTGSDDGPTTDLVLDATQSDAILTHNGGDTLELSALTVIYERRGTVQRFTPAPGDTSDGDGRLTPGDRIQWGHGFPAGDLTVTVAHGPSSTVLFEDRVTIPGAVPVAPPSPTPTPGPAPTPTPTPGPAPTPTPSPTPTPTPKATATATPTATATATPTATATATPTATPTPTPTPANEPPTAQFVASPTPADTGETVTFDASGSSDPDGTVETYEWDFDDDGEFEATGETATHSFSAGGDRTVTLRVTDDDGATGTTSRTVFVDAPPVARFTYSVNDDGTVTLDASNSTDPDGGTIQGYRWEFSNTILESDGETTTHEIASGDPSNVTLTVLDDEDNRASTTREIPYSLSVDVPGFGFGAALVAVLLGGALVRRRYR